MIIHDLTQGTPEWLAYRLEHDNASDAAAMLGVSSYKTRQQLIIEYATGVRPEPSDEDQARMAKGHELEAMGREYAEKIIGSELFPVTASADEGRLSASFDGLTMDNSIAFEHKTMNARLRDYFNICEKETGNHPLPINQFLPDEYAAQLEQQCIISGCEKVLFMASEPSGNEGKILSSYGEYFPNPEMEKKITGGWKQFHLDVGAYMEASKPAPPKAVGKTPETLPALLIQLNGAVTASNLDEFKMHAIAVISNINRNLRTDQDFADAEKTVKWCSDVETRLSAAREHALSQTASIADVFRVIEDITAETRNVRLELDKLVRARKEELRAEIVSRGVRLFREHVAQLNETIGKPYMPPIPADFNASVKGKRTITSLNDAVNDTLAQAKIAANEACERIIENVRLLEAMDNETGLRHLFNDEKSLVQKDAEYVKLLVKNKVSEHEAHKARIEEAIRERVRLQAEAQAKALADRAAKAEAEKAQAEQAKAEAQRAAEEWDRREAEKLAQAEQNRICAELAAQKQDRHEAEKFENAQAQAVPNNVKFQRAAYVAAPLTSTVNEKTEAVLKLLSDIYWNVIRKEKSAEEIADVIKNGALAIFDVDVSH